MAAADGASVKYGYDQANRLTSVGNDTSYSYSGDGLRMSKTVNGTTRRFAWDLAEGMPDVIDDGASSYVYGPGGLPLEQVTGGTVLWFHHDQLGSTRVLTDTNGQTVATYTYTPYGEIASSTGGVDTPLLFDGQYRDDETGLYQLRARYYDPTTAQFMTLDPLVAVTRSPYAYVAGDPLGATDQSGLDGSDWNPADWFVNSDIGRALNGWANGVTGGLSSDIEGLTANGAANVASDKCTTAYKAGNFAGVFTAFLIGKAPVSDVSLVWSGITITGGAIQTGTDIRDGKGFAAALDIAGLGAGIGGTFSGLEAKSWENSSNLVESYLKETGGAQPTVEAFDAWLRAGKDRYETLGQRLNTGGFVLGVVSATQG